jgi:hypothetical protein
VRRHREVCQCVGERIVVTAALVSRPATPAATPRAARGDSGTRRPRVGEKLEAAIRRELAKGRGIHAVARAIRVGAGTVQRVRAEPARTA